MISSQAFVSVKARRICLLLLMCGWLAVAPIRTDSAVAAETQGQPFATPDFERLWTLDDGPVASGQASRSWLWGPSPGVTLQEPFSGVVGNTRTVQYFDKARMELNSAVTDTTSIWRVSTGLLVTEMVTGK